MCFGCSKEPSASGGSFEYPQHMLPTTYVLIEINEKISITHSYIEVYFVTEDKLPYVSSNKSDKS